MFTPIGFESITLPDGVHFDDCLVVDTEHESVTNGVATPVGDKIRIYYAKNIGVVLNEIGDVAQDYYNQKESLTLPQ